ncbi:glycine zipper domain-containing protein [Chitinophagaceae bacterium LB-8]|uniref:Glycine zipper domain-containing protein n=1 Tax=Paraflavisolibacter caeni TaxID=2982496 RepID=A0A9X2XND1_9BACT|nr:glycine zipper domain-containing protein [Paraflavisolibacter caeni]MCU7547904.1 glycine zipper domain-containing protein [Paraflavisolibacter caeni]
MKRILPFFSIAVVFAACSNNPKTDAASPAVEQVQAVKPDTSGLAEYQMWKLQQQIAEIQTPEKATVQYAAAAPVKKAKKTYHPAAKPVAKPAEQHSESNTSVSENSNSNTGAGSIGSESTNTAEAPAKKGWSKSAKGAVIGGATGAAAGAVINKKNRVMGAVIGGVLGAGGGYVIGRDMDKKDGRY